MARPNIPGGLPKQHFQGFNIYRDGSGWYWSEGGYFDTIGECRDDIRRWNHENGSPYVPGDTPSLPDPWWHHR